MCTLVHSSIRNDRSSIRMIPLRALSSKHMICSDVVTTMARPADTTATAAIVHTATSTATSAIVFVAVSLAYNLVFVFLA